MYCDLAVVQYFVVAREGIVTYSTVYSRLVHLSQGVLVPWPAYLQPGIRRASLVSTIDG